MQLASKVKSSYRSNCSQGKTFPRNSCRREHSISHKEIMLLQKSSGHSSNLTRPFTECSHKQLGLSSARRTDVSPVSRIFLFIMLKKILLKSLTLAGCFLFVLIGVFAFFSILLYIFNPTAQARTQITRWMPDPSGHSCFNRWTVWRTCSHNITKRTNDCYHKNYQINNKPYPLQSSMGEGNKKDIKKYIMKNEYNHQ